MSAPVGVTVFAASLQRVMLEKLGKAEVNDLVVMNLSMLVPMLAAGQLLKKLIPWEGAPSYSKWLIFLSVAEAVGMALLTISLLMTGSTLQSIYSRGCELAATVVVDSFVKREVEAPLMTLSRRLFVLALAVFGAVLLLATKSMHSGGLGHTSFCLAIIALRSSCYAFMSIVEDMQIKAFAVSPYKLLHFEVLGGGLMTLLIILPISLSPAMRDAFKLVTLPETIANLQASWNIMACYAMFLAACLIQNAGRILVLRRLSAVHYAFSGILIPFFTSIIQHVMWYMSEGKAGEPVWAVGDGLGCVLVSYVCVCVALYLFMYWSEKPSALFLGGMLVQRQHWQEHPREALHAERMRKICRSGEEYRQCMIGCYAGTASDYRHLAAFFGFVARAYHRIPSLPRKEDAHVHHIPTKMPRCLGAQKWDDIDILRFRTVRNFESFPFPSDMTAKQRSLLHEVLRTAAVEFGDRFALDVKQVRMADVPEKWPMNEYEAMHSAGLLEDWPENRSFFNFTCRPIRPQAGRRMAVTPEMANKVEVSLLVNEEDHMRFICTVPEPDADSVALAWEVWTNLIEFVSTACRLPQEAPQSAMPAESTSDFREESRSLCYAYTPEFGYLASCPSNCGTGFKIGVRSKRTGFTTNTTRRLGYPVEELIQTAFAERKETFKADEDVPFASWQMEQAKHIKYGTV
ncbi:mcsB [Symbiodinium natans]|uniref:McsB protein n=1 Tax=Symbiodinium natans TaxID=878477 RepID=A0A812MWA0_9DINO|nr:mcsB [Symbiodinium natans]